MNRYGKALIQRVAHGHAITQAMETVAAQNDGIVGTWNNPVSSLLPNKSENTSFPPKDSFSLGIWLPRTAKLDLPRMELLWRFLSAISWRLVFEIAGNRHWIRFTFRGHKADEAIVRNGFSGLYPESTLAPDESPWWRTDAFGAYYECDAGIHPARITLPETLIDSLEWPLIEWLLELGESVGFVQYVVEPVGATDRWHRDIEMHHDLAFMATLASSQSALSRYSQQNPSSELRTRTEELKKKANPDQPFFGVALRCGVLGNAGTGTPPPRFLDAVRMDGRALTFVQAEPPPNALRESFFRCGACTKTGMLLNSAELTTVAHVLPAREGIADKTEWPIFGGELPPALTTGTAIGHTNVAGVRMDVCIPPIVRNTGAHLIAAPGSGKSTVLKSILLQDANSGHGAAMFDPHGDSIIDVLAQLQGPALDRCIYFNPGDPSWIPCWNPLALSPGADPYLIAAGLLAAFKRISEDWGARIEAVLRNAFIALMFVRGSSFSDLFNLTRHKSPESDAIRAKILEQCPDPIVRNFWRRDFVTAYSPSDIASCQNKLLKLISGGPVARMLSQRENRIDIRKVIESRQLLLVDLSSIGREACEFLGSFMLTLFVEAALSRANRNERVPYSILVDEAHAFVDGDAIQTLMTQGRKYGINAVFAHQMLGQLRSAQVEALKSAGSRLMGRVDFVAATQLSKELFGQVTADELTQLKPFHMIARIGTDVVRFRTPPSNDKDDPEAVARIIAESHKRYYVPADSIKQAERPDVRLHAQPVAKGDVSYGEF